ncbi:hypothetical protein DFH08DRAFT_823372 [Mycena albidolilacea]|uniref:Uncharacterized protein n=1 Tax=Mycena albidolilacea TaxID=1033008 RepID=A0AAD6Z662_9AGAR|nr:hypothetical protein DFH08DRAFT_823372 [Mycena albidolilacea]
MDTGIPAGTFRPTRTRTRKNRTRIRVGSKTRMGYPRVLDLPAGLQTRRVDRRKQKNILEVTNPRVHRSGLRVEHGSEIATRTRTHPYPNNRSNSGWAVVQKPIAFEISNTYHALRLAAMYVHVGESIQGHYIEIGGCFIIFGYKEHISQKEKCFVECEIVFGFVGMSAVHHWPSRVPFRSGPSFDILGSEALFESDLCYLKLFFCEFDISLNRVTADINSWE